MSSCSKWWADCRSDEDDYDMHACDMHGRAAPDEWPVHFKTGLQELHFNAPCLSQVDPFVTSSRSLAMTLVVCGLRPVTTFCEWKWTRMAGFQIWFLPFCFRWQYEQFPEWQLAWSCERVGSINSGCDWRSHPSDYPTDCRCSSIWKYLPYLILPAHWQIKSSYLPKFYIWETCWLWN